MEYLKVPNLEKWQHYKDRNPPWIKLHRDILNDYKYSCLQDASKLHLIMIWLLASQLDNKIPNDEKWIRNRINASSTINLKRLIELGFLEYDSKTLARRLQSAIVETETETETEKTISSDFNQNKCKFESFWKIYPIKTGKKPCLKKWKIRKLNDYFNLILEDIEWRKQNDQKWLDGFIPNPLTYINQNRWEDDKQENSDNGIEPTFTPEEARKEIARLENL